MRKKILRVRRWNQNMFTRITDAYFEVKKNDSFITFDISKAVSQAIKKGETEINLQIGYQGSTGITTKFHSRSASDATKRPTLKLDYEIVDTGKSNVVKKTYAITNERDVVVGGDNYGVCTWEHKDYIAIMNLNAVQCYWSIIGFRLPTSIGNSIVQASISLTVSERGLETFFAVHKVPTFKEQKELTCAQLDQKYALTYPKIDAYSKVTKTTSVVSFEVSEMVNDAIANNESEINIQIGYQGSDGVTTKFYSREASVEKRPTLNLVVMEAVDSSYSAVANLSGGNQERTNSSTQVVLSISLVVAAIIAFMM